MRAQNKVVLRAFFRKAKGPRALNSPHHCQDKEATWQHFGPMTCAGPQDPTRHRPPRTAPEVTAELWILDRNPHSSAQTSYAVIAGMDGFS